MYFEEADAARTDAAASQQQTGYRVRVLEAAQAAARKRTAEQTQQTLLDERRAKLEKLEPALKALQTVGGKLRWILHDRAGRPRHRRRDGG